MFTSENFGILGPWPPVECHYCHEMFEVSDMTKDHIVPKALGGRNATWNYVAACAPCNQAKADQFPTCRCETCSASIVKHEEIGTHKPECHYCRRRFPKGMIAPHLIVRRKLGGRSAHYNYALACAPCAANHAGKPPSCDCVRCTFAVNESARLELLRSGTQPVLDAIRARNQAEADQVARAARSVLIGRATSAIARA